MINKRGPVELSKHCFDICETLKTVINERNTDELSELVRMTLKEIEMFIYFLLPRLLLISNDFRRMHNIEGILKRGSDAPKIRFDEEEADSHRKEIQRILHALIAPGSLHDGNGVIESTIPTAPVHSGVATAIYFSESSASSAPPIPILCPELVVFRPIPSFSTPQHMDA